MITKIVIEYFKPNYMSGLYSNRYNPVSRVSLLYQHITHMENDFLCRNYNKKLKMIISKATFITYNFVSVDQNFALVTKLYWNVNNLNNN